MVVTAGAVLGLLPMTNATVDTSRRAHSNQGHRNGEVATLSFSANAASCWVSWRDRCRYCDAHGTAHYCIQDESADDHWQSPRSLRSAGGGAPQGALAFYGTGTSSRRRRGKW